MLDCEVLAADVGPYMCLCDQSTSSNLMVRSNIVNDREDFTPSEGPRKSSYLSVFDDDEDLTGMNGRRSSSRGQAELMEQLEVDSGHGTSLEHGTDCTDTADDSRRVSLVADEDVSTPF